MVEKMKKYSFLIYHKTYQEFLENIRQAGVVHIVTKQKGVSDDAADLRKQLSTADLLKDTIQSLQHRLADRKDVSLCPLNPAVSGNDILAEYEQLKFDEDLLLIQKQNLQREIDHMSLWGDFDLGILSKFEETGRQIKFFHCREREFQDVWTERFNAMEVLRKGGSVYFITLTPTDFDEEPEAEKVRISDTSLGMLQKALQENESQTADLQKQFDAIAVNHLNNLKETQRQLLENIDLSKVHLQAEKKADEKLILLEGWVPEINESKLIRTLETMQDVYHIAETPDKDDKSAPILLKNNRFARLFEPIAELYELPNYHELDLTPFFAPFFLLFFGLCLGDAGYGLLILLATLFARTKVNPALKPILTLASVLGAATVFCGMVSGTLFGIELLNQEWAWLTSFKNLMLESDQLFNMALILGVVQILYGMIVRAYATVRSYGWAYSLERWGWVILFIGGGSLYLVFYHEKELPPPDVARYVFYAVLGISVLFILFLNTPGRNPLINFLSGLWNTFNMATGLVGDLLSYIRLFALGLSGSVMGLVFNKLAMELSGNIPVVSQLAMIAILLFGHSINIFMSSIGAFVHPMRLTFVEFYKNAGFEGGGKSYKPFKYIPPEN